jgi:hypothetical protein
MTTPIASFNLQDDQTREGLKSYSTYAGSDIKASFGPIEVGNLQGLSVSVNRETRPIFVMGNPNAVSFSRGKRGIAGSIILSTFDKHALEDVLVRSRVLQKDHSGLAEDPDRVSLLADSDLSNLNATNGYAPAKYSDELPPFDITLVARNSYGHAAKMTIRNVILISEGTGVSVDDATQESQLTFVAKDVDWWEDITDSV